MEALPTVLDVETEPALLTLDGRTLTCARLTAHAEAPMRVRLSVTARRRVAGSAAAAHAAARQPGAQCPPPGQPRHERGPAAHPPPGPGHARPPSHPARRRWQRHLGSR